jgi:hypothetical protein
MDGRTRAAVDWLLASDEPAIRLLTRRDVLGREGRRAGESNRAVIAGRR